MVPLAEGSCLFTRVKLTWESGSEKLHRFRFPISPERLPLRLVEERLPKKLYETGNEKSFLIPQGERLLYENYQEGIYMGIDDVLKEARELVEPLFGNEKPRPTVEVEAFLNLSSLSFMGKLTEVERAMGSSLRSWARPLVEGDGIFYVYQLTKEEIENPRSNGPGGLFHLLQAEERAMEELYERREFFEREIHTWTHFVQVGEIMEYRQVYRLLGYCLLAENLNIKTHLRRKDIAKLLHDYQPAKILLWAQMEEDALIYVRTDPIYKFLGGNRHG